MVGFDSHIYLYNKKHFLAMPKEHGVALILNYRNVRKLTLDLFVFPCAFIPTVGLFEVGNCDSLGARGKVNVLGQMAD